jgi:2-polyprenyl-6-methoxyphenol hydroxylase-like FAD-dependent oxidoreductase
MGWDENRAYDSIRCGVTSPSLGRPDMTTEEIYDVAIVGYGPVGQVLAALLGHQGHRVVVLERHHGIYPLPRAVRMDGEVQRVLQNVGSMDDIAHELLPVSQYTWFGADGDPILVIDIPPHPSGWPDVLFHQPTVETALRANVTAITNVDVKLGWIVEGVSQTAGDVAISATSDSGDATTIRARYAVGADGANSVVRQAASISQVDLGFSEFWLVVDIRPSDMADFDHLPTACQRCDPKRPVTIVGNGTHHRRWEFMLLPGETPEDFADPARVWELLGDVTGPDRAELVRHAVYNFRSLISESLQAGRIFLAGDAAHVMPPFMGEGMCTGIRDANNLAWKLDLVLRGLAAADVLQSYTTERLPFVHHSVNVSVEMGKVSCLLDPMAAAGRDAVMRSAMAPPPPAPPRMLGPLVNADASDALAGSLSVQGTLEGDDSVARRADGVLGAGFTLIVRTGDPLATIDAETLTWFGSVGGTIATLDPTVEGFIRDADGRLTRWMDSHGVAVVLSRPDQYVYGSSPRNEGTSALLNQLRVSLR